MTVTPAIFDLTHAANQVAAAGFVPVRRLKVNAAAVQAVQFTGSGLDDATSGGTFAGLRSHLYRVTVSLAAGTDKFDWTRDGVTQATDVAMTGGGQTLDNGVTITFSATTGHTLAEYWEFEATITTDRHKISGARKEVAALRLSLDFKVWYQWQQSIVEPTTVPIISSAVVATGLVQAQIMPAGNGITIRVPWSLQTQPPAGAIPPVPDLYLWIQKHTSDALMQISEI
ncbi:MAG TPA: hypothetical protein ENI05_07005 [Porticoccus sp.]|nr:hypothetical protein [Porticoccus sp.]